MSKKPWSNIEVDITRLYEARATLKALQELSPRFQQLIKDNPNRDQVFKFFGSYPDSRKSLFSCTAYFMAFVECCGSPKYPFDERIEGNVSSPLFIRALNALKDKILEEMVKQAETIIAEKEKALQEKLVAATAAVYGRDPMNPKKGGAE